MNAVPVLGERIQRTLMNAVTCRWLAPAALTLLLGFAAMLAGWSATAQAIITPVTTVAGPSSSIIGVGNVAMAPDGTGGVVFQRLSAGSTHVFVSQYRFGGWGRPVEVDAGQPGPASYPAIAAANGGELLVVWVRPYESESIGGENPTTLYQLMSSVLAPGATSFAAPVPVDPQTVGGGTGVSPMVAMAPNGSAYVAYRAVTNALNPDQPQPLGTPLPMHPGDELIDVRVARFNGLAWTSLGAVNAFPNEVTMRPPTAANAPAVAIGRNGQGVIVWQEPTIDGVARIWARRLFGLTLGNVLQVSPQTINSKPVTVDADAPSVAFGLLSNVEAVFRLTGGAGSPLGAPSDFVNSLNGAFTTNGGATFGDAAPMMSATPIGAPSVSASPFGRYLSAFTAGGSANLVRGTQTEVTSSQSVGSSGGEPALATLNPAGGDAIAWPTIDSAQRPVVDVQQSFPNGGLQTAILSAPISGVVRSLTMGTSGAGDALIAFQQGSGSTAQVAVATVQAPSQPFSIRGLLGWITASGASIDWSPARTTIGEVTYSVVLDGRTIVSGLTGHQYQLPSIALGTGIHHLRIVATDDVSEQTLTPVTKLKVDDSPPQVSVRGLRGARVRVTITDKFSGARIRGTVISFGDGSRPVRSRLTAVHRYRRPGSYRITVRCGNLVGIRAVDRVLVRVR